MLHLALVGNLMSTLQANPGPCLYDKMAVPIYPNDVGYDQIELNLEAANEANLKRFVRVCRHASYSLIPSSPFFTTTDRGATPGSCQGQSLAMEAAGGHLE